MEFVINALIHPLWPLLCHHPPQFIPWHKSCPPFSPHWIGKKMNGLTSRIFRNVEHTFSWKNSLQELYWVFDKDPDGSKVLEIYIYYMWKALIQKLRLKRNRFYIKITNSLIPLWGGVGSCISAKSVMQMLIIAVNWISNQLQCVWYF